jgi:hypothetical protein
MCGNRLAAYMIRSGANPVCNSFQIGIMSHSRLSYMSPSSTASASVASTLSNFESLPAELIHLINQELPRPALLNLSCANRNLNTLTHSDLSRELYIASDRQVAALTCLLNYNMAQGNFPPSFRSAETQLTIEDRNHLEKLRIQGMSMVPPEYQSRYRNLPPLQWTQVKSVTITWKERDRRAVMLAGPRAQYDPTQDRLFDLQANMARFTELFTGERTQTPATHFFLRASEI